LAWEAFDYCYNQLKAIELIEKNPWLKDRHLKVTHDNMSLRPLETAEKCYSFQSSEECTRQERHSLPRTDI
jgi:hypothetical protein